MIGAQPGQVIADRYEVGERLGEGAFGVTYGAVDRVVGRDVVLKIAGSESAEVAERLRQEAKALGTLQHPRIVGFLAIEPMSDGRPVLVFERVRGESVADRLERMSPLPFEEALAIARALAEGLDYAHRQGIIHRDLKPSNVLLPGGIPSEAKLADFGALGRLEEGGRHDQTRVGQLFGTILYMAPEQVRADSQTPGTDVYGLGTLLYEMLFGRPPFHEKRENLGAFVSAVVSEAPSIPEAPEVPARVRDLLARMLAKEPGRRPSLQEVQEVIAAEPPRYVRLPAPVAAHAPGSAPGGEPASSRPRRTALYIGVSVILVTAVAGVFVFTGAPDVGPIDTPGGGRTAAAILLGIVLGVSGPLLAVQLGRLGDRRLTRAQREANEIVIGTRSADVLGSTLSRYVEELMEQCRRVDERFLGATIARMVADYESAETFDQRQTALMNAVELLDRLMERLAPWWVRHQKALAFAISLAGVVSGVVSILAGVSDLLGR